VPLDEFGFSEPLSVNWTGTFAMLPPCSLARCGQARALTGQTIFELVDPKPLRTLGDKDQLQQPAEMDR
jgi:hypothetical protein